MSDQTSPQADAPASAGDNPTNTPPTLPAERPSTRQTAPDTKPSWLLYWSTTESYEAVLGTADLAELVGVSAAELDTYSDEQLRRLVDEVLPDALAALEDNDNWNGTDRDEVSLERIRTWLAPPPEAVPAGPGDDPADHGTAEHCERCTGSGCSDVAATMRLTMQVDVRRAGGPAQPAEDLRRALQDALALAGDRGAIEVGNARYVIEQVISAASGQPA